VACVLVCLGEVGECTVIVVIRSIDVGWGQKVLLVPFGVVEQVQVEVSAVVGGCQSWWRKEEEEEEGMRGVGVGLRGKIYVISWQASGGR